MSEDHTLFGELSPNKKFQFPENWTGMCSLCKVMTIAKFASENSLVISLFPATMRTSRFQVYLHPPDVIFPIGRNVPQELMIPYWVFSLEYLTLSCFCGENRNPSVEVDYFKLHWF